jgi:hypothetical protein
MGLGFFPPFLAERNSIFFRFLFLELLALQGSAFYMRPHASGTGCTVFLEQVLRGIIFVDSVLGWFPILTLCRKVSRVSVRWTIADHTFLMTQGCIDHDMWLDTSVKADSTHKLTNVAFHLGLIFATALAFALAHNTVFI